jgi:hypothetical protein
VTVADVIAALMDFPGDATVDAWEYGLIIYQDGKQFGSVDV